MREERKIRLRRCPRLGGVSGTHEFSLRPVGLIAEGRMRAEFAAAAAVGVR